MRKPKRHVELLQGTLDMLVLRTLVLGPAHCHAIAKAIQSNSDDVLRVEEGSLYPALHRMEQAGWIRAEWGMTEKNREARFYSLTPLGRKQLAQEEQSWEKLTSGVSKVMRYA